MLLTLAAATFALASKPQEDIGAQARKWVEDAYVQVDAAWAKGDTQKTAGFFEKGVMFERILRKAGAGATLVSYKTTVTSFRRYESSPPYAYAFVTRSIVIRKIDPQTHKPILLQTDDKFQDLWSQHGDAWQIKLASSLERGEPHAPPPPVEKPEPPVTETQHASFNPTADYKFEAVATDGTTVGGVQIVGFDVNPPILNTSVPAGRGILLNERGQVAYLANTTKGMALFLYTPEGKEPNELIAYIGQKRGVDTITQIGQFALDSQGRVAYLATFASAPNRVVVVKDGQVVARSGTRVNELGNATLDIRDTMTFDCMYFDERDNLLILATCGKATVVLKDGVYSAALAQSLSDGTRRFKFAKLAPNKLGRSIRWSDEYVLTQGGAGRRYPFRPDIMAMNDQGRVFVSENGRRFWVFPYDDAMKMKDNSWGVLEKEDYYKRYRIDNASDAMVVALRAKAVGRPTPTQANVSGDAYRPTHQGHGTAINGHDQVAFFVDYSSTAEKGGGVKDFSLHSGILLGTPTTSSLIITRVRLGVPELTTEIGKATLKQDVYVQGKGSGMVWLRWRNGNGAQGGEMNQRVSITDPQEWVKLDAASLRAEFPSGREVTTVALSLDVFAPGSTSCEEDIVLTGFVPSKDGWGFANHAPSALDPLPPTNYTFNLNYIRRYEDLLKELYGVGKTEPLCNGMSLTALRYYKDSKTKPSDPIDIARAFIESQLADSGIFPEKGYLFKHLPPLFKEALADTPNNGAYTTVLASQGRDIFSRIQGYGPCVINAFPRVTPDMKEANLTDGIPGGHAVVGTGAISSKDIYDKDTRKPVRQMRYFSVYDPDSPGRNDRSMYVLDFESGVPQFTFKTLGAPNSEPHYYAMWLLDLCPWPSK